MARANYFPEINVKYSHKPRVLFNNINSILEPSVSVCLESSVANCERFFLSELLIKSMVFALQLHQ